MPRCASIVFVSTNDDKGQLQLPEALKSDCLKLDVARLSINYECYKTQFLTGIDEKLVMERLTPILRLKIVAHMKKMYSFSTSVPRCAGGHFCQLSLPGLYNYISILPTFNLN